MKIRPLALALAFCGATACSQEAPPAPNDAAAAPPVATAPTEAKQVQPPIGDAMFSIDPGSFRTCDAVDGAITSTAKWDVAAKQVAEVSIYVVDAKGERKLWLNGGSSGQSTTGNWVFPDTKFQLVERESGKSLAELTVKANPCE